jgi:biotin synthase
LRTLGPLVFWPANSLFVEGYLTTRGDAVDETYRMIADAGFEVDGNALYDEQRARDDASFRLAGADGQILKPDIAAPTRRLAKSPAPP